eukprot:4889469-Pleurochrysis_carterae.AAC.1
MAYVACVVCVCACLMVCASQADQGGVRDGGGDGASAAARGGCNRGGTRLTLRQLGPLKGKASVREVGARARLCARGDV